MAQKKIDKEPEEIVRLLREIRAATLFLQSQREVGVGLMEQTLKLDRAAAERFYSLYRDQYNPELTLPDSVAEEWIAVGTFRAKENRPPNHRRFMIGLLPKKRSDEGEQR